MNINLSLRHKLILIVLVTITGFALMGLYSASTLTGQGQSARYQSDINQAASEASRLQARLLLLDKLRDSALVEEQKKARDLLNQLNQSSAYQLDSIAQRVQNPKASQMLQPVQRQLPGYLQMLEKSLQLQHDLGNGQSTGALAGLNQQTEHLAERLSIMDRFASMFKEVRTAEKAFLLNASEHNHQTLIQKLNALNNQITVFNFDDVFAEDVSRYQAALEPVVQLSQQQAVLNKQIQAARNRIIPAVESVTDYLMNTLVVSARQATEQSQERAYQSILLGSALLAILVSGIVASVAVSIARNMKQALSVLNDVAAGNLTREFMASTNPEDEFNQLAQATNTMTGKMGELIRHIQRSTSTLKQMSEEMNLSQQQIQQGSETISDKSNAMVAATEQISVSAEEVAQSTSQVSEATREAWQASQSGAGIISQALDSLREVARNVDQTSDSVARLGQQSKEIDTVIELIEGVAEQTNLLALNAAIEAARAGEAGRGFAVVADEVRTLAEQTVIATSNITERIEQIQQETRSVVSAMALNQKQVEQGQSFSQQAEQAIQRIEQQTSEAAEQASAIYQAISEVAQTTARMAQDMDRIASEINSNHQASNRIRENTRAIVTKAEELEGLAATFTV
ncbi:methyl-accepting chemotaxis protein [Oceanospirillum sediminis]|uniref:Methyl-accepting chemotaxis protein n=1 Tax=Oceanospirillum sediminis TaxID=2760088 RepID=A0A839IK89_9GAMM|nr:methyl-accepting chemotaxis protein [Oceanospirillum sediminis]MBB1485763.1 hypothetical protein [Oceanospirillum sediminis]